MAFVTRSVLSAFIALMGPALALGVATAQPPETVLIQGQLLDGEGTPIVGLRQYRVRFFDAEVDGSQLGGDVTDVTQVNAQGLFAIAFVPPAAVLNAPAAWYELALDSGTPAIGVGTEDVFPGRVRVHSVPFARVAGEALSVEVGAIGGGAVSAAEFNSLAGITGNVQSQLNTKADAATVDDAIEAVTNALDDKPDLADVLPREGEAFVVVETTADPAQNGTNLVAAYAQAAALTPHGQALAENNRAVVIVLPGRYDLGTGQLELNTEFVDLVGLSSARDDQYIFGTSNGEGTGVLRQTANNVRIENLVVECTRNSGGVSLDNTDPAAYFPDSGLDQTLIRNCQFLADNANAWSMRMGTIDYAGQYEDVHGGAYAFAGTGTASGTFTNCTGELGAFAGVGGLADGTFINCTGGDFTFGGMGGTASGNFVNCTGGSNAFGGGSNSVASGNFTGCTGGNFAFGGGFGSVASGNFTNCTGATGAFGGSDGTASGFFNNCVGGGESFGGFGSASGGRFYYCVGGVNSFTMTGGPTVLYCVRNGLPLP